jgi:hypothetical protein
VSNLDAFSDGLRVLTTIMVERRRARRRHGARRASDAPVAAVPARGLIHVETALMRTLYALHSIDRGRPCIHQAGAPIIGHGPHRRPHFPPARAIVEHWISSRRETTDRPD